MMVVAMAGLPQAAGSLECSQALGLWGVRQRLGLFHVGAVQLAPRGVSIRPQANTSVIGHRPRFCAMHKEHLVVMSDLH